MTCYSGVQFIQEKGNKCWVPSLVPLHHCLPPPATQPPAPSHRVVSSEPHTRSHTVTFPRVGHGQESRARKSWLPTEASPDARVNPHLLSCCPARGLAIRDPGTLSLPLKAPCLMDQGTGLPQNDQSHILCTYIRENMHRGTRPSAGRAAPRQ